MQALTFVILLWVQPVPMFQGVPQHLSSEDGLSNNIVYDVYQDHEGFIWIATENGLNRFDGYEFKKFYHSTGDSTTLSSNIVRSIVEDEDGNLWIGTFNGLNLYDRRTQTFRRFIDLPDSTGNRLDLKQLELTKNGRLWFNTLEAIGWFDIQSKEFHFVAPEINPFSLSISKENQVFIQSKEGKLFEYTNADLELKLIHSNDQQTLMPIHWGKYSDKLWSKASERENKIPDLPGNIKSIILMELDGNVLLIGSDEGLFIYSKENEKVEEINFRDKSSTLTNSIRSLYQDKTGAVWVGTLNGLFHFDPYQKPFKHIDIQEGTADIIMGLEAVNDQLFINTFSQKLFTLDLKNDQIEELEFENQPAGFNQIWDIEHVKDSEYPVWLATNEGLYLYNTTNKKLKRVPLNKTEETAPGSFAIHQDYEFVWISSVFGLYQLEKTSGEIAKVIKPYGNSLGSIIQDIQKNGDAFYIATEGDGILVHQMESESMEPLEKFIDNVGQLQTIPIWDLYQSADNLIWIGTNRGLYKLDVENSGLDFISTGTMLENTIIFSIQEDESQNLWLGTEKGIMRYSPETKEVVTYSKSDGILNVEFNRKSSTQTEDGRIWFGGIEGLTVFDPSQIQSNTVVPPVHITSARIITADSVFTPDGLFEKELNLSWNQNTVEFQFTALNYTNPSQNKYRYKLDGYDPAWVDGGIDRTARYVQLPHGEYTFMVQASNNDGVWSTEGAALQINISPPFWKTWWFRIIAFGVFFALLWAVYRYRVKQLLEIEHVKLRIAGDLHDEIGSGLSGIALTGDILSKQLNNGGAKPELVERITQSSRSLASSLDTIVWLIDPKKETLGDLVSKCHITAQELLSNKKVKIDISIKEREEGEVLNSNDRRNLFLFFKEAIHNIAKHSNAQEVQIHFLKNSGNFIVEIKDDGVGFDIEHIAEGRGIGTMNQRAGELQSELILKSEVGKGTQIRLSAKIP